MENKVLYHYGIKGMKWGVRRTPFQLGHKTSVSEKKQRSIQSASKARSEKKSSKHIRDLTDAELRRRIERLQLENRYRELSPKQISRGRTVVNTIAKDMAFPAAKEIGQQLIKSGMAKSLNSMLNLDKDYRIYTNNQRKK